ncbi:NYN domain-containing protein [Pseudotabrizicola sediminis]|uniref:NYN domain-containing protein n=1 Tax=Pseudotabrizicola sediminis TaxID=2486418 RepID=UPI0014368E60|nr:NYN domain-containing protein [Pseudotabrizicola sediminis]
MPATAIYYRDARDLDEHHRLQRFFEWLERHGIETRGSQDFARPWYQRERYGSNLIQLAVDAMEAAHDGASLVIVAGDAKLIPLLTRLEKMDVPVTLISSLAVPASIAPPPPLVDLAEEFIDLNEDERFFLGSD